MTLSPVRPSVDPFLALREPEGSPRLGFRTASSGLLQRAAGTPIGALTEPSARHARQAHEPEAEVRPAKADAATAPGRGGSRSYNRDGALDMFALDPEDRKQVQRGLSQVQTPRNLRT